MELILCYSLPPEVLGLITDRMDIASLIRWRATCAAIYAQSTASLSRMLTRLVNPFLSHPAALLDLVARFGAVIGGEVALAYVRRDVGFRPQFLEIFVSRVDYEPFCRALLSTPSLSTDIILASDSVVGYPLCSQRDIVETMHLRLRSGLSMHVRRSSTLSPLSPIARTFCTAFMNFVTPKCFGCAYPGLTLNNQALLCEVGGRSVDHVDGGARLALVELGINTAENPAGWPQYRVWSPTPGNVTTLTACWRSHFICPGQGRFFGDRGSLMEIAAPLDYEPEELGDMQARLFGTTILWRLSPSYQCIMRCQRYDRLLPIGVTSQVISFVYDNLEVLDETRLVRGRCSSRNRHSELCSARRAYSLPQ